MAEKQKESSSSAKSTDKTSLLDMDIGNDFLTSWKSVSVAEDDPMDFDFSKIAKGIKKAFNFDNVNLDFNLDAYFGKLSSFNLDMPVLNVSSPIKKSAKPTEKSKEVSTDGKTPRKSDQLTFQFDFNEFEDISFGPSFTKKAKQTNANKDAEISASLSGSLGFGIQPKETITAAEEETNSKFDSQLGAPNFSSKEKPQESLTEEHFPSKSEMANDQVTNTGPTPLLEKPISNSTQQPYRDNFPNDGTTLPEPHAKESVSENSSNQQTAGNSQEEVSCLSRKERTHTGSEQSIVHKKADFGIDRENLQMGKLPVDMPRSHSSNNQNSQLSGDNPVPLDGKDNAGPAQGDSQFEQTLTTSASNAILADNEKPIVQKTTEVFGSTERKHLANITNIQQPRPSMVEEKLQFIYASTREYIDKLKKENMTLMKENMTLMKLLADRNKIFELTGIELRKLKAGLQKMQQQNLQLAQANNQMLTELTIDKDRLKLLQHKLGCKHGLLVAKGLELKEKDETVPSQKVDKEAKLHNEKLDSSLASRDTIKPSNINRRQQSKSLGPLTVKQSKDKKDDNKRQCVRRQSARLKSEEPKPVDDVFEVESNTLALGPPRNNGMKEDFLSSMTSTKEKEDEIPDSKSIPVRRQSARFKYEEPKPAEVFAVESVDIVSDVVVHDDQMHEDVSTSIHVPVEKNDEVSDGRRLSVRRQSARFKSEEPKPVVDTTAIVSGPVHDDQMPQDVSTSICLPAEKNSRTSDCRRLSVKRQSARFKSVEPEPHPSVFEINTNDCMQINVSKSTSLSVEKDGIEGESEPQNFGRPSVGRPLRQAVKKVNSYREVPLNVKMRRID